MARRWQKLVATIGALSRALASALLWFFLLRALGVISATVGVYVLFGLGWALVALGVSLVVASEFIRKGLTARA